MSNYLEPEGYKNPIRGLIQLINDAYQSNHFICLALLLRKLLETMLIHILLKNPGPTAVWDDSSSNDRKTLHRMLKSFWEFVNSIYKPYIVQYDSSILNSIRDTTWNIKKMGDQNAHTLIFHTSKNSVDLRQDAVQKMILFLDNIASEIPRNLSEDNIILEAHVDNKNLLEDVIMEIEGNPVLIYRNFPNQYIPILIFFEIYRDEPKTYTELRKWLDSNAVKMKNISIPIRRLLDRGSLAVIKNGERITRYLITDAGRTELKEYVVSH